MMVGPELAAIVLAAGQSSRMGEFKPLLDLAGQAAIQRAIELFRASGITQLRVVVGHESERLKPLLASLAVPVVENPNHQQGMFSSVQCGVRSLDASVRAFFLLPADIALVRPQTIQRLIATKQEVDAAIVYPTFDGERGHPPLIDCRCLGNILSAESDGNLRTILTKYGHAAVEIACADAAVLMDMDTPEDYELMKAHLRYQFLPSPRECLALLTMYGSGEPVVRHGQAVAALAQRWALYLNERFGAGLDVDLVVAAGILHDIAKGLRDHASAGASIMEQEGFAAVAECIGEHMDLTLPDDDSWTLREKELIFLADKMIEEDQVVTVEQRFARAEAQGGPSPIWEKIQRRKATAFRLQKRLESSLGGVFG